MLKYLGMKKKVASLGRGSGFRVPGSGFRVLDIEAEERRVGKMVMVMVMVMVDGRW